MKNHLLKTIAFTLLTAGAATLSSCNTTCVKGSGKESSEDRKVESFTKLRLLGGYKVLLKQDSSFSVHVSADDNLLQYIRTSNSGNELKIKTEKNICSNHDITLTIGVKNLEAIECSGAVELSNQDTLRVQDLEMKLNGASKVDMSINADRLTTRGAGSTNVKLRGQATTHDVKMTGAGSLDAFDFVVSGYDIETTGAVHSKINVLKDLTVHSTGASELQYKGNPSNVSTSKTGAADIKKVN
ncbi:head GIN domain-containing protein [Mucilaginibacter yixingensis]|nr:head GIN domain-containing protein [Mucilaginibacter yixingensis]